MLATLTLPAGHELPALQARPTVRVRSADELRAALRQARARALTLDGTGMDRVLRLDAGRGIVEVQAATPWHALAAHLARNGCAIEAFAGDRDLPATVGEAVSRAAAGPDGLPVTAHVVALTLVGQDGELRRADRTASKDLFRLALGGQGVVGVLYSVTLSLDSLRKSALAACPPVELHIADSRPGHEEFALEVLLPPAALDAYLKELRALAGDRRIALNGISVRRYQPCADAFLNWATREWAGVRVRFGLKATLGARVTAAEFRAALLEAALRLGGSFPLHDLRDASRRQLEACYPKLSAFLAEKRRCDAGERLQNAWYRDLLARIRRESLAVTWGG